MASLTSEGELTPSEKRLNARNTKKAAQEAAENVASLATDARQQEVLRQQQQLLLLRHASKCKYGTVENPSVCLANKDCKDTKQLWMHITRCNDQACQHAHCVSRYTGMFIIFSIFIFHFSFFFGERVKIYNLHKSLTNLKYFFLFPLFLFFLCFFVSFLPLSGPMQPLRSLSLQSLQGGSMRNMRASPQCNFNTQA